MPAISEKSLNTHYLFLLIISLLTAIIYLPFLDLVPLVNEETRRALVAKELLARDNLLVATIAGESYTAKPLFFNWLIIVASTFTDNNITEWSARIPSVVGAMVMFVSLFWFTRNWWDTRSQIFFMTILMLSPQIIRKATSAEIDLVFACLVNLSLFAWLHYYQKQQVAKSWLYSALFIGIAYLCKREAALLFYFLSIGGYLVYAKNTKHFLSVYFVIALTIIGAAIAVWLVPIINTYGLNIFIEHTANEINARSSDSGFLSYLTSSALYPIEVFLALLPAGILLPVLAIKKNRTLLRQVYGIRFSFCLLIALINLIPFILLGKSNVRYYLPMFPAVFILITMVFSQWQQIDLTQRIKRLLTHYCPITIQTLLLIIFIGIYFTQKLPQQAAYTLPILIVASACYLYIFIYQQHKTQLMKKFGIFCLIIGLTVRVFDLAYTQPRVKNNTEEFRNIANILAEIKTIAQQRDQHVIASPKLFHALYFYDNEHTITPFNCHKNLSNNYLILSLEKNKLFNKRLASTSNKNIVWHSSYKKKKTIFLRTSQAPNPLADYCASQSLGRK